MSKSTGEAAGNNNAAQEGSAGGQKDKNDSLYENRAGTKKLVRVVTVMAYVISVSFTAILLSGYYLFIWEPPNPKMIQHNRLMSEPQPEYLMDYFHNQRENESDNKPLTIKDIQNMDKKFKKPDDSEILTINHQQLLAPAENYFKFYNQIISSSELQEASPSPTTSTPFLDNAEAESTTSISTTPTIFFYASSQSTEITESTAEKEEEEGVKETAGTTLISVYRNAKDDIDDGTTDPRLREDHASSIKEKKNFEEFSKSLMTPLKRNEARNLTERINGTTNSKEKEEDAQDSESTSTVLASDKSTSRIPADMGAILYRRLRFKVGDIFPSELDNNVKVKDRVTTESPVTYTETSTPEESATSYPVQELRKNQNGTEPPATNPQELLYEEENARDIMKSRK